METPSGSNSSRRRQGFKAEAVKRAEIIKMERQLKQPDLSSVHRVLFLPELLAVIFEHLAVRSDLKTLKNARLVCSLWKSCAFDTFKDNLSLMPTIAVSEHFMGNPHKLLEIWNPRKTLESCAKNLQPSGGLPLKLLVNQWSSEVESFLQDFSSEIVSFAICGREFDGFPEGLGSIGLPTLEHVTFSACVNCSNKNICEQFGKAMSFWKQLVGDHQSLKRVLELEIDNDGDYDNEQLGHCNPVFNLVPWNQVNRLVCSDQFFETLLAASNDFEALGNLEIYGLEPDREISREKVGNLAKLRLDCDCDFKLTHMKSLKSLTLEGGATLTSKDPMSTLLPNLSNVTIVEDVPPDVSVASLIIDQGVFENVTRLDMTEAWVTQAERTVRRANMIFAAFPNITRLKWVSHWKDVSANNDYDYQFGERLNNNCFIVAPVICSSLELLTSLVLAVSNATEPEVFQLVTGIPMDAIPDDELTWANSLDGNSHSICNLKHLSEFELGLTKKTTQVTVTARNTRFLFTAAFQRMDILQDLNFPSIYFEDASCVTGWKEMGRRITVFHPEVGSYDEDHNEVTSKMDEQGDFDWGGDFERLFDGN